MNTREARRYNMTPADKGIMAAKMETLENWKPQTTPRPWSVEKWEKSTVTMGGQCVIVAPAPDGASYGEQVANARLIASAPELLEALRQIVWKIDQTQGYREMRTDIVMKMAREVLAKAEGRI